MHPGFGNRNCINGGVKYRNFTALYNSVMDELSNSFYMEKEEEGLYFHYQKTEYEFRQKPRSYGASNFINF